MRLLGSVIVAETSAGEPLRGLIEHLDGRADDIALCLPSHTRCSDRQHDALLVDLAAGANPHAADRAGLVLFLPRRIVPALVSVRIDRVVLPHSAALDTLARLAGALLRVETALTEAQARLAAGALSQVLSAALLPLTAGGLSPRRQATLLDQAVEHVDRHLSEHLDAAAVAMALHCSRSVLYRAVAPVGGIAALVNRRRLLAVYARLCDRGERASVAALARAHGFADPVRFSRNFKRQYGVTAGELRRTRQRG